MTMFWNLISMMAATVSSWGLSKVGPNTTPRFATVIKFCLWLLATLFGKRKKERQKWDGTLGTDGLAVPSLPYYLHIYRFLLCRSPFTQYELRETFPLAFSPTEVCKFLFSIHSFQGMTLPTISSRPETTKQLAKTATCQIMNLCPSK